MKKYKKHIDLENERYGLFMNENSFNLEKMYGREYLKKDVNFFITLYRINIITTKTHALYGQTKAKDKEFLVPIKLNAMVNIEDRTQDTYGGDESGLVRDDSGNIRIGIYLDELNEKGVEINRGDIIGYNQSGDIERYFEVYDANNVIDTTSQTIGGFKPYWKQVYASPVKEDVSDLIKNHHQ
jgi:hypothetical protein